MTCQNRDFKPTTEKAGATRQKDVWARLITCLFYLALTCNKNIPEFGKGHFI